MKQKFFWFLIVAMVALVSASCVKMELAPDENVPVEIIGTPLADGLVSIQVSPGGVSMLKSGTTLTANDTVSTEKFLRTTYQAIAKTGLTIASWQWTFAENSQKVNGSTVDFYHGLDPGAKTLVTLVGVELNGTAHIATVWVKIVGSLDGLPSMYVVTRTPVAGGMCSYVVIAHKKSMAGIKGNYGYVGTISSPAWVVLPIAAADTNYNYVNGVLVAASLGDIGKYVAIRFITYPGDHEFHVGHINAKDGSLIWGNPWNWFPGGKFTQDINTNLYPRLVANLPGSSGDEGISAIVRRDILSASVIVYTHYTAPFTKGFIQLQNADGTWRAPVAQTAVPGFSYWGKAEILYSTFPTSEILVFRFGANIDAPNVLSTNMSLSSFWDTIFQYLKMKIVRLGN